jgi:hypothetical protein
MGGFGYISSLFQTMSGHTGPEFRAGWPGVDVMIKIFSDSWQFSANKLAFLSNCYDQIFE